MAKTYRVLAGAWSKTKDAKPGDEPVYLTQQMEHRIGDLLSKARIKELVDGGVLEESGADDPEPEEETAKSRPRGATKE